MALYFNGMTANLLKEEFSEKFEHNILTEKGHFDRNIV